MSLCAVAGVSWRQKTAEPVHVLRGTLEHLLGHLSIESPSCEGLIVMYMGEVSGFQGSRT